MAALGRVAAAVPTVIALSEVRFLRDAGSEQAAASPVGLLAIPSVRFRDAAGRLVAKSSQTGANISSVIRRERCRAHSSVLHQERTDEATDGSFVGDDVHDVGAAHCFTVEPLDRIRSRFEDPGANVRLASCGPGVCCDNSGPRHREHEGAGSPMHPMSLEL